ncbi:MAG: hypothetical protein JXB48_24695 [Candidatus Latescibacteria bacterium]|nr:hypothetical protein [Candidatus Latescibacterota bacterium]
MKKTTITTLILMFLMSACSDNSSKGNDKNRGINFLEDPEHHIKDNLNISSHNGTILYTGWYYVADDENGFERQLHRSTNVYFINPNPIVTAENFEAIRSFETNTNEETSWILSIQLDDEGTEILSVVTENAIGRQLAFILDNSLLYVVEIDSQISTGLTELNRDIYSKEELENFMVILKSER